MFVITIIFYLALSAYAQMYTIDLDRDDEKIWGGLYTANVYFGSPTQYPSKSTFIAYTLSSYITTTSTDCNNC